MTAATIDELIVSLSRVNAASKVALRAVEADREGLPVGRHRAPAVAVVGVPCEVHTFSFPRAQGGDILQPDCLLCPEDNTWCEDNPRIAAWTGWKTSSKWPHSPELTSSQALDLFGNVVEFTVPDEAVA